MTGALKSHGGKRYLAQRLVALMPPHTHYVEPFAGGLAVLFAKPCEGISEVVNDLDQRFTTFWSVLQDEGLFQRFQRRVQATPVSQEEWRRAQEYFQTAAQPRDPVECAARFFVLCRQSLAGRGKDFSPLSRNRVRRGMNEQAAAWMSAVDGLAEVHARLRRVVILNQPALEVIKAQDGPGTLSYLDPPYLPETRSSPKAFGPFEMTVEQHEELLAMIIGLEGMVMISGYPSKVYDAWLKGWTRHAFTVPNSAAAGQRKRRMQEMVWCNFKTPSAAKGAA